MHLSPSHPSLLPFSHWYHSAPISRCRPHGLHKILPMIPDTHPFRPPFSPHQWHPANTSHRSPDHKSPCPFLLFPALCHFHTNRDCHFLPAILPAHLPAQSTGIHQKTPLRSKQMLLFSTYPLFFSCHPLFCCFTVLHSILHLKSSCDSYSYDTETLSFFQ